MKTPQTENKFSLYLSYAVLGVIFIVDCLVPFGIFGGVPYVIGLIVLMWVLKPSDVIWFSASCGIATVLAFFLGEDYTVLGGLMNRLMAIFTMVAMAMLIKRQDDITDQQAEQQKHLNSVVEKRTEGLKQVVDQLEEMKIRLAESEELGHFGFWEFYPSNQQMIWSNGVFAIYGFPITPQAPSMQEFLDQCHTEDAQTLQRSIQYGLTEKKPYTVEYRLIMPDGNVKWIYNRGRPIVNKQGSVEMLVGTIQDVTTLKHSQESVQANRARYTTLFKSAAVGKALMIPNKRILEVNTAFVRWVGYPEKTLLKIPIEKLIHEDDRSMDNAYAREMISGEIEFYQKEKRFIRRDGTILWGLFSVSPVHDAEDKISCFAVEVIDITAHKNTEMAMKKAQESWHDAEEAVTESEASRRLAETALKDSERARQIAEADLAAAQEELKTLRKQSALQASPVASITPHPGERMADRTATTSFDTSDIISPAPVNIPQANYPRPDVLPDNEVGLEIFAENMPAPRPEATGDSIPDAPLTDKPLAESIIPEVEPPEPFPVAQSLMEPPAADINGDQAIPEPAPAPVAVDQTATPPPATPAANAAPGMTQDKFNRLIDNPNKLIASIGYDGCYKRVGPGLPTELGFELDELDNQHFLNFIHQEDRALVQDQLQKIRKRQPISRISMRHMSKFDGYRRFVWDASVDDERELIYSVMRPDIEFTGMGAEPAPAAVLVEPAPQSEPEVAPAPEAAPAPEQPVMEVPEQPAYVPEPPVAPDPVLPAPVTPAPVTPAPVAQEHVQPEPVNPESGYSAAAQPAPEAPVADTKTPEDAALPVAPAEPVAPVEETGILRPVIHQQEVSKAPRPPLPQRRPEPIGAHAPPPRSKTPGEVDWRRLTDRMPFQVWMLSTDRSCKYVNKKVRDFTGLPFEQLEGKGWGKAVHPEDYRKYLAYYGRDFEKWEPMGCMYRLRRNDGIYRWMQESSVPIRRPDGSLEGYLLTCMDVSLLKTVDSKFTRAFDDAVNLVDVKSALHPCQKEESQHALSDAIKIADALMLNADEVPNATLARLMDYAGNRLLYYVNAVVTFGNADKDANDLLKRSVSIESVLESTVEMLAPLRREEGPRFQINYRDDELRVMVDKVLVHRLFEILMRNLLEWAESRIITIDIIEQDNEGIVEIKHIGPVLNAGHLLTLEDVFRAGKATILQKKAGLELSLIKRLAEAMTGGMAVRVDEDGDPMIEVRFNLSETASAEDSIPVIDEALRGEAPVPPAQVQQLTEVADAIASLDPPAMQPEAVPVEPVIPEPVVPAPQPVEAAPAPVATAPAPQPVEAAPAPVDEEILIHENGNGQAAITRHKVLVGETNSETQRLVRSLLQPYYDLTIVPSTDDLLKQADTMQYDLLMLDVQLQGGKSGVDVLRELRKRPQYTRIPAIAVAASTTAMDQRELIDRAGFDGFLRKPFSIVELLETVERMIES
ncbi:MAG: PAS domain S-box protein [Bacteroidota bacterium]